MANEKLDYESLVKKLAEFPDDEIVSGTNQDGEVVIVQRNSVDVISVMTSQHNGWVRENIYHKDGTVEELYERGQKK